MTIKSLIIVGALTLSAVGVASAKSYHFTLTNPTQVGATQLKAGSYDLKVSGTDAIFTDDGGKSYKVPFTATQNTKKFDSTVLNSSTKNGKDDLTEIDLEGSTTKLQFGQ